MNFVVGRDKFGRWIVTEAHGFYGRIFANRDAAVRFVAFELGGRTGSLSISRRRLSCLPNIDARLEARGTQNLALGSKTKTQSRHGNPRRPAARILVPRDFAQDKLKLLEDPPFES